MNYVYVCVVYLKFVLEYAFLVFEKSMAMYKSMISAMSFLQHISLCTSGCIVHVRLLLNKTLIHYLNVKERDS